MKIHELYRSCKVKQDQPLYFPKLLLMPHLLDLPCSQECNTKLSGTPHCWEVKMNGNGLRNKWKGMEIDEKQKKSALHMINLCSRHKK